MRLDKFELGGFDRGMPWFVEAIWLAISGLLMDSWLPGSAWRKALLRLFGARIAQGVVIKPRLRVKFPWRLELGEHCWLGEGVWIDNLAEVRLRAHSCVSQDAYLCTGSHDWSEESFDLITASIEIGPHAWVGARCTLAPGTRLGEGAVLAIGSVAKGELAAWMIHAGYFALPVGPRPKP